MCLSFAPVLRSIPPFPLRVNATVEVSVEDITTGFSDLILSKSIPSKTPRNLILFVSLPESITNVPCPAVGGEPVAAVPDHCG